MSGTGIGLPPVTDKPPRGWWWPVNSKRAHYMDGGRSLCGKWLCLGNPDLEQDKHDSNDNCAECKRRFQKNFGNPNTKV